VERYILLISTGSRCVMAVKFFVMLITIAIISHHLYQILDAYAWWR